MKRARTRRSSERRQSRLFHELLATIRQYVDAHCGGRDFLVVFESGGFHGGRGHRKPGSMALMEFLRHYTMETVLDGFNTTKCCPRCGEEADFARKTEYRSKCCTSEACLRTHAGVAEQQPFLYDRDSAACSNLAAIDASICITGERPAAFQRPKKETDKSSMRTPNGTQ